MPKDHFVNAGYLRGFGFSSNLSKGNQFIYEYSKTSNKAPLKGKSVREVCKILNHNSTKIEEMLGKIEHEAAGIIAALNPVPGKVANLTDHEKEVLLKYTVLMFLRNPSYRDGVESYYKELMPNLTINYAASLVVFELEDLIKKTIQNSKYPFFCLAPKSTNFITSDNPVVFDIPFNNEIIGLTPPIIYKNADILFPLKKDILLLLKHRDRTNWQRHIGMAETLKTQDTKRINKMIAAAALENVYTSESSDKLASMIYKQRHLAQKLKLN